MENKRETTLVGTQTSRARNTEHTEETTQRLMATNLANNQEISVIRTGPLYKLPPKSTRKGKRSPKNGDS